MFRKTTLGLIASLLLASCAAEDASDALDEMEIEDGTPGEDPDAPSIDKKKDCVYVNWCNEPGKRGSICKARSGCTFGEDTVRECYEDTYYVCGKPVAPWYFVVGSLTFRMPNP